MKHNEYYNKNVMNFRQLALDLKKQGFICKLSEDESYLSVYYLYHLDEFVITLTDFKDWSVIHYQPFKEVKMYSSSTNWGVIKLLRKLLKDTK